MAQLSEEELNALRGMKYAEAYDGAQVYEPRPDMIRAINEEWEVNDFWAWLQLGTNRGWCSEIVCAHHDGLPMTDEELDDEEPYDLCVPAVRIWGIRGEG